MSISFTINNKLHTVQASECSAFTTLADYIRNSAMLKGTKVGCGEGGCGACTVLVSSAVASEAQQLLTKQEKELADSTRRESILMSSPSMNVDVPPSVLFQRPKSPLKSPRSSSSSMEQAPPPMQHRTVNACITPLFSMDKLAVTTIEGVGDVEAPSPVQERMAELHATQCGFCTPGVVMATIGVMMQNPNASTHDFETAYDGNLCRCTGYRPILDAAKTFVGDLEESIGCAGSKGASVAQGSAEGAKLVQTDTLEKAFDLRAVTGTVGIDPKRLPQPKLPCMVEVKANGKQRATQQQIYMQQQQQQQQGGSPLAPISAEAPGQQTAASANAASAAGTFLSPNASAGQQQQQQQQQKPKRNLAPTAHHKLLTCKDGTLWLRPTTVEDFADFISIHPYCAILGGNPGFYGLLQAHKKPDGGGPKEIMWTGDIEVLQKCSVHETNGDITIGAGLTVSEVIRFLSHTLKFTGKGRLHENTLTELITACRSVGSCHVRNASSFVGQLLATPSGDLVAMLLVLRCQVEVHSSSQNKIRYVAAAKCVGPAKEIYRGDVITNITVPCYTTRFVGACKAAPRRDNSAATCVLAMSCRVEEQGKYHELTASDMDLVATGLGHFPVVFDEAQRTLGRVTLQDGYAQPLRTACDHIHAAIRNIMHPTSDGRQPFRSSLTRGLLFRLFSRCQDVLGVFSSNDKSPLGSSSPTMGIASSKAHYSKGTQIWEQTARGIHKRDHEVDEQQHRDPVGAPVPCITGLQQATGQAVYVDDIPTPQGCYFGSLVKSTHPHARLVSVDASPALAMDGVIGYYDINSMPVQKVPEPDKEKVFAKDTVEYVGDVIGLIVAESQLEADRASQAVEVQYQDLPAVFDIDQAIKAKSFFKYDHIVHEGDVDGAFARQQEDGMRILHGVFRQGGQEHFYLEPHALLVVPGERDEIDVYSMTQCVNKTQVCVAETLGIPQSKVNVKVKRIGGAFGGKEVRTTYTSAVLAVAAMKLKRPIRWLVNRAEDMRITGGRHPIKAEWAIIFENPSAGSPPGASPSILALDVKLYANGGCTANVTSDIMNRALMHICNAYKIPNVRVQGFCCKTNIVSNTAFRGFGAPQAMLVMENIVEFLSSKTGVPIENIQYHHLMKEGETTHFGQQVSFCRLQHMWSKHITSANYEVRKAAVQSFNSKSRWIKRGIALVPTLYGINFPLRHLNQANAYVCVYVDGTAVVHHSAVEMGQGINTKCAQVAAQALGGIPVDNVHVAETAIHTAPNTSPTAASMGSDLNCMAVLDACLRIVERLEPVRKQHPKAGFRDLCKLAYKQRISLAADGHYKTAKGAQYDWDMKTKKSNSERGPAFSYFAFGMASSEVELDVLTGSWRVLRTDMLMDCGDPLNPAVDIGQVEGSYVQGLGWLTSEELIYGDSQHPNVPPGVLQNAGPHGYKIPAASDVPLDMRIELLSGAPNPCAVHGSKAVGEPPLFLAASAFFALKKGIVAARLEEGLKGHVMLEAPLTTEKIRMACVDEYTQGTFHGELTIASSY